MEWVQKCLSSAKTKRAPVRGVVCGRLQSSIKAKGNEEEGRKGGKNATGVCFGPCENVKREKKREGEVRDVKEEDVLKEWLLLQPHRLVWIVFYTHKVTHI